MRLRLKIKSNQTKTNEQAKKQNTDEEPRFFTAKSHSQSGVLQLAVNYSCFHFLSWKTGNIFLGILTQIQRAGKSGMPRRFLSIGKYLVQAATTLTLSLVYLPLHCKQLSQFVSKIPLLTHIVNMLGPKLVVRFGELWSL